MFFLDVRSLPHRFRLVLASFQLCDSLPFAGILSQEHIQAVCDQHKVSFADERVFSPAITLWGFLSQVIQKGEQRSCLAAIARIGLVRLALGRGRCANNSGSYCRARGRMPLGVIRDLTTLVAENAEKAIPSDWLWYGRHVKLVDGTTVTMPDTEANQEAYPQQAGQKQGLGFPIARLVGVLSLATGMLSHLALAPYRGKGTGETALLRQLMPTFQAGEIVLLDKLYSNYWTLSECMKARVDVVTLLNESRKIDLSQAIHLGNHEYLIRLHRPDRRSWMDPTNYETIPKTLELRLIETQVTRSGFRPTTLQLVTTLLDSNIYRYDEVAQLYSKRWDVELDIRAIKVSMGMGELRCKSPEMVCKEIWTCLLAYNLIRLKLLQAAQEKGVTPLSLSFTNGLQLVGAGWAIGPVLNQSAMKQLVRLALKSFSDQTVGKRAGRAEPRAVKRRPKPTPLLTMPRREARELLLAGVDPYKKQK